MPTVFGDVVKAICHAALANVSIIGARADDMSSHSADDDDVPPAGLCVIDLKREQQQDKGIAYVSDIKMNGSRPSEEEIKATPVSAKIIQREYTRLFIIPRRKGGGGYGNNVRPSFRPSVLPSHIFVRSISPKVFQTSTSNFTSG